MSAEGTPLLAQLDRVISREEGMRLLWGNRDTLTDDFVGEMLTRAEALRGSGDPDGANEFDAWGHEARNIITRIITEERFFSNLPKTEEEVQQLLGSFRHRYDDAFIDFSVRMASVALAQVQEATEQDGVTDASAIAAGNFAVGDASLEVLFLSTFAKITKQPYHQAQADLTRGALLLLKSRWQDVIGQHDDAAATRHQAAAALTACAENQEAPAAVRAKAEGNLAALAGPEHLDEVNRHQATAQHLAEDAGDLETLHTARRNRAYWAVQHQDWASAYDLYRQNIEDAERALWKEESPIHQVELVNETQPDYEAMVQVCLERAKSDPSYAERALEYAEHGKARAFVRTLAGMGSVLGPVPPRLWERRDEIFRRFQATGEMFARLPSHAREKNMSQVEDLQAALATNDDEIQSFARARATNRQCAPCTFAEMVQLVPIGGIIVSYYSLPTKTLAFVLGENGLTCPPVDIPLPRLNLSRAVVNITIATLIRGDYGSFDEAQRALDLRIDGFWPQPNLHYLYEQLVEPIKEQLSDKNVVYIVPHGPLRNVPFHALLLPDESALIDQIAIAYSAGLAVLRENRAHARRGLKTCFACGVSPDQGGPPSAKKEAETVAQFFGVQAEQATRAAVLDRAGQADVIHLACHSHLGNVFTNFKGLALEDGILTSSDIAAMACQSALVTLTGCSTAEADVLPGREMAGLVGAFFRAGSPSVIASLWPAADRVVVPTMQAFYSALKRPGTNKAKALREAQRAVKSTPSFDHPYFWAPFCLWGDIH